MGIPGFTAEATDYKTENTYYTVRARGVIAGQVIPQQNDFDFGPDQDPCRGACKCCAFYQYQGCCGRCDSCLQEPS